MNPVFLLGIVQQSNQLRRDIAHVLRTSQDVNPDMAADFEYATDALLQLVYGIQSASEHILITEHSEPIDSYTGLSL